MVKWHSFKSGIASLFLFLFLSSNLFSEQVGKLIYIGLPENLDSNTYTIPEEAIMMSEKIVVGHPDKVIEDVLDPDVIPSIFFVIDNSGSMNGTGGSSNAMDKDGNRFKVTSELLDSIFALTPSAEVGLAVFGQFLYFDPEDDDLFSEITPAQNLHKGGFIPLLQLDREYSYNNGTTTTTGTGYEILKYYLTVRVVSNNYTDLDYVPSNSALAEGWTNITAGFEAAKDAFDSTNNSVENHYIIFFSDGDATAPTNDATEKMKFIEGNSVPTTFTIFFDDKDELPESIDTMTQNIQKNGYSDNNKNSKAWPYKNENKDSLLTFVIDSVFSIITTVTNSKPLEITINDSITLTDPQEVNGDFLYTLNAMLPFYSAVNDLKYSIKYEVNVTDPEDNTTHLEEMINVAEFTILLEDTDALPSDEWYIDYWERRLEFYHNGQQITEADETMIASGIEVRFVYERVDTFYNYSNVNLSIKNSDTDNENFGTSKPNPSDNYYSIKVPIEINSANNNDGKIQLSGVDDIIVTFKNPLLPLDTLCDTLPFRMSGTLEVESISYFDEIGVDGNKGADGKVDSVVIKFNDDAEIDENDIGQLVGTINFSSYRNFEILDTTLSGSYLILKVNERTNFWNTAIDEKSDSVKINQTILEHGGWVDANTVLPLDKMAPVIVAAVAVQYEVENDSTFDNLTVEFSEKVEDINFTEPFLFLETETGFDYNKVNLTFLSNDKDNKKVMFKIDLVDNTTDIINIGDSIWINTVGSSVKDVTDENLTQQKENNIKRVIKGTWVAKPFDIEVTVTGPIDFLDPNDNSKIDPSIIDVLDPENLEQLEKTDDDEYHGLLIIGETIGEGDDDPENIELKGEMAIYDCLGNTVWKASKMSFDDATKTLYYVWNGKNSKKRVVGSGTYISVMHIETVSTISGEVTKQRDLKKFLNVKN